MVRSKPVAATGRPRSQILRSTQTGCRDGPPTLSDPAVDAAAIVHLATVPWAVRRWSAVPFTCCEVTNLVLLRPGSGTALGAGDTWQMAAAWLLPTSRCSVAHL